MKYIAYTNPNRNPNLYAKNMTRSIGELIYYFHINKPRAIIYFDLLAPIKCFRFRFWLAMEFSIYQIFDGKKTLFEFWHG